MRKGSKMTDEQRKRLSEVHKGQNLGRHLSKDTRRKISESQKGKIIPLDQREKISSSLKGREMPYVAEANKHRVYSKETKKLRSVVAKRNWSNPEFRKDFAKKNSGASNYQWKEDRTVYQEKCRLRSSIEWAEWRTKVFERDSYTCQDCGVVGGQLEPHHIIPIRENSNLLFDLKNGITLCRPCHQKTIWKEDEFSKKYLTIINTSLTTYS